VSARLRRKIDLLTGKTPAVPKKPSVGSTLPLFPEAAPAPGAAEVMAIGAQVNTKPDNPMVTEAAGFLDAPRWP
jgi:hypothetical protein